MSALPKVREPGLNPGGTVGETGPLLTSPDSDLISSRAVQLFSRAGLFLLGLVMMDQMVLRVGDKLAASSYWTDSGMSRLAQSDSWDVVILGTCRAFFLPTSLLGQELEKRVFNMGRRVSRIATMAFNLNVAKKTGRGKYLILVVDQWVLEETPAQAVEEMNQLTLWQSWLETKDLKKMNEKIGLPLGGVARQRSGLLKYQGQGAALRQSLFRWMRRQPAPSMPEHTGRDQYTPYLDDTLVVTEQLKKSQQQISTRTEFGTQWLDSMIADALAAGMKPILVVPPMHRLAATAEVNADLIQSVQRLSSLHHVPVLNYLDVDAEWASRDDLWAEVTHLNAKGIDIFARRLSQDLRGVMP